MDAQKRGADSRAVIFDFDGTLADRYDAIPDD